MTTQRSNFPSPTLCRASPPGTRTAVGNGHGASPKPLPGRHRWLGLPDGRLRRVTRRAAFNYGETR